ncbi:MAG: 50S ribosomal protein L15 [Candidatus Bathyarchaeota archaeon]|nr:50S ribosomal protein L15 [Candidatus Bathyarchaeota archaeon]
MPHKLRKTRKNRGSRTQGYGRIGQHRKTGSKGFRKAGRHKHLWSYVVTYEPDYFGKHGFTSPKSLKQKTNTINLKQLEELSTQHATEKEGKLHIDLTRLGYTKLLGTGKTTKPLVISVASASKAAAEKIAEAGGEVLTSAQEHGE